MSESENQKAAATLRVRLCLKKRRCTTAEQTPCWKERLYCHSGSLTALERTCNLLSSLVWWGVGTWEQFSASAGWAPYTSTPWVWARAHSRAQRQPRGRTGGGVGKPPAVCCMFVARREPDTAAGAGCTLRPRGSKWDGIAKSSLLWAALHDNSALAYLELLAKECPLILKLER